MKEERERERMKEGTNKLYLHREFISVKVNLERKRERVCFYFTILRGRLHEVGWPG